MSNYYEYRSIKAAIAEKLMTMDGWKVYGYTPDESDAMTDYWSPAHWGGVAEKNGYILCVDVYGAAKETVLYETTRSTVDMDKIRKLEAMTMVNGASAQEEYTAKKAIEKIMAKAKESDELVKKEIGRIPAHMAHPGKRCNWHIEKDGVYIAKGTGILQFETSLSNEAQEYIDNPKEFERDYLERNREYYSSEEAVKRNWEYHKEYLDNRIKSHNKYNAWIHKIDVTCGGMVGKGKTERYEKQVKTIYKEELKPVESSGSIKEGQCFILKGYFTHGCSKGLVYRIKTILNDSYIMAVKLNKKYTKECDGQARGNHFNMKSSDFQKSIENGSIAFCTLETVKTPYRVEKVVKVTDKEPKATEAVNVEDFTVQESMHTKTGEKIWLVKCTKELDREEYKSLNAHMKELGGYYSRFVHAFIFKENPTELLKERKSVC